MVSLAWCLPRLSHHGNETSATLRNGWTFVKGGSNFIRFSFKDVAFVKALLINNKSMLLLNGEFFGKLKFSVVSQHSDKNICQLEVQNWPAVQFELCESDSSPSKIISASLDNCRLAFDGQRAAVVKLESESPDFKSFHVCLDKNLYIGEVDESNRSTGEGYLFDPVKKQFSKFTSWPESNMVRVENVSLAGFAPFCEQYFFHTSKSEEMLNHISNLIPGYGEVDAQWGFTKNGIPKNKPGRKRIYKPARRRGP